jgi:hypothetical protein
MGSDSGKEAMPRIVVRRSQGNPGRGLSVHQL